MLTRTGQPVLLSGMFPLVMEERLNFGTPCGKTSIEWSKIVTLTL